MICRRSAGALRAAAVDPQPPAGVRLGDRLEGRDQQVEALLRVQPARGDDHRAVERRALARERGDRVGQAHDPRRRVAERLGVVAPVGLGEHRERVEVAVAAADVGGQPAPVRVEVHVLLRDRHDARPAERRREQVEARARADHDAAAHRAQPPHEQHVGPQAAPRVGVVVGVHEHARQPPQHAPGEAAAGLRPRALVVDRGDRDALREGEEGPVAPAHDAHDLDGVVLGEALGQAQSRRAPCRPSPTRAGAGCARRGRRPCRRGRGARAARRGAARAGARARRAARARGERGAAWRPRPGGPAGSAPARPRSRAWSAPRGCSRPCSRAARGGRRSRPRGTRSPRRGWRRRRGACRAGGRGARRASRRFQTSRCSPGSASSARSRLAEKRSPSSTAAATTSITSPRRRANR